MDKKEAKRLLKKIWHFIWEDNSIWSWIANVIIAFVLIKFVVYPLMGFALNTDYPVVAVVSSSMEHKAVPSCARSEYIEVLGKKVEKCAEYRHTICGNIYNEKKHFSLEEYWDACGSWYESNAAISKDKFSVFSFKDGFNKGDIMVLMGKDAKKIIAGDVIVFRSSRKDPIIHRVVKKTEKDGKVYFQTKGDNNEDSIKSGTLDETTIDESRVIGKAVLKIPLLGYIKIWFVEILKFIGFA